MTIRIAIDLNVRVRGNQTYAGFEDVSPAGVLPEAGDQIDVWEPESRVAGTAEVTEVDADTQLIYLSLVWEQLRPVTRVPVFRPSDLAISDLKGCFQLHPPTVLLDGWLGAADDLGEREARQAPPRPRHQRHDP